MKIDPKLMADLQHGIKIKEGYISQFQAHLYQQRGWGYEKLAHLTKSIIDDERDHLKTLAELVVKRGGVPKMGQDDKIEISTTVPDQLKNDLDTEMECVQFFNDAIVRARDAKDDFVRRVLEHILKDDEKHVVKIEKQQNLIKTLGMQPYLQKVAKAG